MNDGGLTPQQNSATTPIKTGIPVPDVHPLHMLDNQADPETKPRIVLQKPIRTYESDMAEALANKNTNIASIAIAEQKRRLAQNSISTKSIPPMTPAAKPVSNTVSQNTFHNNLETKSPSPVNSIDQRNPPQTSRPQVFQTPATQDRMTSEIFSGQSQTISEKAIAVTPDFRATESEDRLKGNFGKKLFMFLLSIIFITCGVGGGYYLYTKSPLAVEVVKPTAQTIKIPSIIQPEEQKVVPIGNLANELLGQSLQKAMLSNKVLTEKIYEYVPVLSTEPSVTKISSQNFIEKMGYSSPDMLNRSLIDNWMLGKFDNSESESIFLIFKTDFFQNAFAGMLRWENSMPDELATLLNYSDKIRIQNINGTSTLASYFTIKGKFKDRIVLNRDVRSFVTDSGLTLVVYSFVDKDTLIITTSESALKDLIGKLEKQTYMR